MGIYTRYISTIKAIDAIKVGVQNALKDVVGVYSFVNGKRSLVWPDSKLIYTNTTPGEFSFTVPDVYDYIYVEYAGAAGGRSWVVDGSGPHPDQEAGSGSILGKNSNILTNHTITGIVGARPSQTFQEESNGGQGYNNGANSLRVSNAAGGGGGGSTSVVINGQTYEAGAGGGGSSFRIGTAPNIYVLYGSKGGGEYGGEQQDMPLRPGNSATDPNKRGNNTGNGYIKIWGVTGPTVKPQGSV